MIRTALAFVILTLLTGSSAAGTKAAAAQPPPPVGPCYADLQRFCPNVPIGEGRRIGCLGRHLPQLAPACRERVPKMQKLFDFGKRQRAKVEAYLAKHDPEALKEFRQEHAPPASLTARQNAVPPASPTPKQNGASPASPAPKQNPPH